MDLLTLLTRLRMLRCRSCAAGSAQPGGPGAVGAASLPADVDAGGASGPNIRAVGGFNRPCGVTGKLDERGELEVEAAPKASKLPAPPNGGHMPMEMVEASERPLRAVSGKTSATCPFWLRKGAGRACRTCASTASTRIKKGTSSSAKVRRSFCKRWRSECGVVAISVPHGVGQAWLTSSSGPEARPASALGPRAWSPSGALPKLSDNLVSRSFWMDSARSSRAASMSSRMDLLSIDLRDWAGLPWSMAAKFSGFVDTLVGSSSSCLCMASMRPRRALASLPLSSRTRKMSAVSLAALSSISLRSESISCRSLDSMEITTPAISSMPCPRSPAIPIMSEVFVWNCAIHCCCTWSLSSNSFMRVSQRSSMPATSSRKAKAKASTSTRESSFSWPSGTVAGTRPAHKAWSKSGMCSPHVMH
mmetsp:Transcript_24418/g.70628  ORF Transcript_24418/g.70628 Transcript_24418/m.70628 type:complete len:419 (-) Transcript_24418:374-1630(-)